MAKAKPKAVKGNPGANNKVANSRVRFLHDAAILLANTKSTKSVPSLHANSTDATTPITNPTEILSRVLAKDLRSVAMKSQIRLSTVVKHSICKNCHTVLQEGSTCTKEVENRSKGGKKPWADVNLVKCLTCGLASRFPVAAKRQKRKTLRVESTESTVVEDTSSSV